MTWYNNSMKDISTLLTRARLDLGDTPEKVPVRKIDEPLVEVKPTEALYVRPIWEDGIDTEAQMYRNYIAAHPEYAGVYLRKTVAGKLTAASALLPETWALTIIAGHRPVAVQQALYDQIERDIRRTNPHLTDAELGVRTRRFVSDPRRKDAPHSCGAAVDVIALHRGTDELVDFGSPANEEGDRSRIGYADLPSIAQQNRETLLRAMLQAGFAPLESEWWHFSYGDQNWAAFYEEPFARYGAIEYTANETLMN